MPEQRTPAISAAGDETVIIRRPGPASLGPGTLVGHTYVLDKLLAYGRLGEVYRARHVELGTVHAIKFILPSLAADPKTVQLLVEETRKLERVHSDALVAHQGLFRGEGNVRYLVTEHVEGDSLTKILETRRLEPDEVLRLLNRLAQGLAAAHEKGVIHRDISTDNIILPGGDVDKAKLIAFGIAEATQLGDATMIGGSLGGNHAFVSPEQVGLFGARVDARSDIYSLGLVLAAASLGFGKRLEMGAAPATVVAARRQLPNLSAVPEPLQPVIARMLQPRPEDRPGSMRLLLDDSGKPQGPSQSAPNKRSRTARPLLLVAASVVVLAAAIAAAVLRIGSPPRSADDLRRQLAESTGGFQCAALDYEVAADRSVRLSGHVSTADDIERLKRVIGDMPGVGPVELAVRVMAWPQCQIATILKPLLVHPSRDAPRLALTANQPHLGDRLIVDVNAPGFDGFLYIDYFDGEGEVFHLLPNERDRLNLKPAHNHFILGCPPWPETVTLEAKAGGRTITLIAASRALFPDVSLAGEHARDYFAGLSAVLDRAQAGKSVATMLSFSVQEAAASNPEAGCPSR
jgi:hypothetical protein